MFSTNVFVFIHELKKHKSLRVAGAEVDGLTSESHKGHTKEKAVIYESHVRNFSFW